MFDVTLESTDKISESAFAPRGGAISYGDSIFGITRVLCDPPMLKRYYSRWKHDVPETKLSRAMPSRGELSWYCRWKRGISIVLVWLI